MAKSSGSGKLVIFLIVALVGAAAGFGYFNQTARLSDSNVTAENEPLPKDAAALKPKPTDIILGDPNAIVTIVEYSSLSCPGCAHFHTKILPTIEKEFITTGKVKLIFRPFPLNEPAIRGSQLIECANANDQNAENFIKVLFDMQSQWAFNEDFLKNLKQIALVGGVDSAAFDSCMADKELENRILTVRQEGETALGVNSTPTFFINGMKYEGGLTVDGFRTKLEEAGTGTPKTE